MSFIDVEGIERAARMLRDATENASRVADRMEDVTHRLTVLLGSGYGNNVERLIELLEKQQTP